MATTFTLAGSRSLKSVLVKSGQEPINYVRQIIARYRTYMDLIAQQKAGDKNPALKH